MSHSKSTTTAIWHAKNYGKRWMTAYATGSSKNWSTNAPQRNHRSSMRKIRISFSWTGSRHNHTGSRQRKWGICWRNTSLSPSAGIRGQTVLARLPKRRQNNAAWKCIIGCSIVVESFSSHLPHHTLSTLCYHRIFIVKYFSSHLALRGSSTYGRKPRNGVHVCGRKSEGIT